MYQTGSTGIARVHIHTYIHIYNSVAATAAAALLPLHARVIVLAAAASCSAVPLCILLALRARVHGFCCCLLLWSLHHEYHCITTGHVFLWHASLRHPVRTTPLPKGSLACTQICDFSVCVRLYIFERAPIARTLKKSTEEGHPDTVVEVWARSVQCVARGVSSNCFVFGGSG